MSVIDSAWFYEKLAERGSSLRDMARFMGLDPSAVSRMLSGERKMSAEEQDQVSDYLDVSLIEVAARRRGEIPRGWEEDKQSRYAHDESETASPTKPEWKPGDMHPIFGCMKGTMTIPDDLDLTAPADPEWGKVYED